MADRNANLDRLVKHLAKSGRFLSIQISDKAPDLPDGKDYTNVMHEQAHPCSNLVYDAQQHKWVCLDPD